jgi:hypothetical protein
VTFSSIPNGIIEGNFAGFHTVSGLPGTSKFLGKSGLNTENTDGLAALLNQQGHINYPSSSIDLLI